MNTINVHRKDILWRFYCKKFTVEEREIEPPKNLCRYFWTSVSGFCLWLGREVRLPSLWLLSLTATIMLFGIARAIPNTSNIVTMAFVITIAVIWNFVFLTAIFVSLCRLKRIVESRVPWVKYLIGFAFIGIIIVHSVTQGTLWPELKRLFGDMLQWGAYMLIAMVIMLIIALTLSTVPHHHLLKLRDLFSTIGAVVSAKKNRVCPPVKPPDDFKVKP